MTPKGFDLLVSAVRKHWTSESGVVVFLESPSGRKQYRLCAGKDERHGIVPEEVMLWTEDNLLYSGPMNEDLKRILTKLAVCRAKVTTFRSIEYASYKERLCLSHPGAKRCAKNCREAHHVKQKTV